MASIISAGTTSGTSLNLSGDTSGVLQLASNGSTTAVTIDTSQKVGIGTASPTGKLHVYGSGEVQTLQRSSVSVNNYTLFKTEAGADQAYLGFSDTGVNDFAIYNVQNGYIRFGTNNAERMRITSGGDVAINNTGLTGCRFGVSEDGSLRNAIGVNNTASGSGSQPFVSFQRNTTQTGTISNTNSATAYNTSSDYRLKENVAPMTGALAKVAQLKPCNWTWKLDGSVGQGFIAHELQEFAPYAVSGEKDGKEMQGVDYGKITPLLTAALQEALAKIESLEARLSALESK